MKLTKDMYVLATKKFPLEFVGIDGDCEEEFCDNVLLTKEECEHNLKSFDNPEAFQILMVRVTYEF